MNKILTPENFLIILLLACTFFVYPTSAITDPFITINTVADHAVGDIINITGTTNLPANTTLVIQTGPRVFTNYEPNYFFGMVKVTPGTETNTWLVSMNSSTFSVDQYNLLINAAGEIPLINQTWFNVTPRRIIPQTTPANISPTVTEETRVLVQNQTGTPDLTALPTPKPAALPAIIPFIALGCIVLVAVNGKRAEDR